MPRNLNAAVSGKAALPQLSAKMLEELIPGPVTKEQFTDIFENFKKAFIERAPPCPERRNEPPPGLCVAASANILTFSRFENVDRFDTEFTVIADNLRQSQAALKISTWFLER